MHSISPKQPVKTIVRNLKTYYQLVLILIGCWLALRLPIRSSHALQESGRLRTHILAIDDRAYPDMQVYLTVTDVEAAVPVRNLVAQDFLVTAAGSQRIVPSTVATSTINNRPVHLVVVLDLTGSVSAQEFTNMQTAAALLIASLEVQDQVGVVTMDHEQAVLLQPLSPDHNAAINAIYSGDIAPVSNRNGNVVTDGIYQAVEALVTPGPEVRPTVVVFTDVPGGGIRGEHSFEAIQMLAAQRGTTIHVIYFETETEGRPGAGPPIELETLAAITGGVVVTHAGDSNVEDAADYDDDRYLPEMAQQIADILEHEYRLDFVMPFVADDQTYPLTVIATALGVVSPAAQADFRARSGTVRLVFAGLENGQQVTLPLTLQIETAGSSNTLETLALYRINNTTGEAVKIADLLPQAPEFMLVPGQFAPGVLTLKISGTDMVGNSGEKYLTLILQNGDLPAFASAGEGTSFNKAEGDESKTSPLNLIQLALIMIATGVGGSILSLAMLMIFRRRRQWGSERKTQPMPALPPVISLSVMTPSMEMAVPPALQAVQQLPVSLVDTAIQALHPTPPAVVPADNGEKDDFDEPTQIKEAYADEDEMVIRAYLIGQHEQYPLYEGENTIGRHNTNMVQIRDATTSRHHAVIEIYGNSFEYLDWQASHPSCINGRPIAPGERCALKHDDRVQLGMTVLRFVMPEQTPPGDL